MCISGSVGVFDMDRTHSNRVLCVVERSLKHQLATGTMYTFDAHPSPQARKLSSLVYGKVRKSMYEGNQELTDLMKKLGVEGVMPEISLSLT